MFNNDQIKGLVVGFQQQTQCIRAIVDGPHSKIFLPPCLNGALTNIVICSNN